MSLVSVASNALAHRRSPRASRPVSGLERVWMTAARLHPPFAIQLVLELDGRPSLDALRDAARRAAAANPGMRARLRGAGPWSRWTADGPMPDVRSVEAARWDGLSGAGAEQLWAPIDLRRGPLLHLWRVDDPSGDRARLVLRAPHAAFDGRGALHALLECARAMRGERLEGSVMGPEDVRLVEEETSALDPLPPPPEADRASPWGALADPDGDHSEHRLLWRRATVDAPGQRVLPRVLAALYHAATDAAREVGLRVSVPVDLRRHRPDLHATGNLTGLVRLDASLLADAATQPSALREAIAAAIQAGDHTHLVRRTRALRWMPVAWMAALSRHGARDQHRRHRTSGSATVSNLGLCPRARLDLPGAPCRGLFWIPPGNPDVPLFVGLVGEPDRLELCALTHTRFVDQAGLDALVTRLVRHLRAS